jgi:hypothetical protein
MDSAYRFERPVTWHGQPIRSWAAFHDVVKRPDKPLLAKLDDYEAPILVAGCQRSGTTALARLLKRAEGFVDHAFGHDDELDGALLLAGHVSRTTAGRHCFQTTYLNDRFDEYFERDDFKLVWMLREPRSVVYSMLHNWRRDALNRLFDACGAEVLEARQQQTGQRTQLGSRLLGPSRLTKACASYVAKTGQTFALAERLGERMAIIDYDELVAHKHSLLPQLCTFVGARYEPKLADTLHDRSTGKRNLFSARDASYVDEFCAATYHRARALRTIGAI